MKDLTEKEWSPNYPVPESEVEAYKKKIEVMMDELRVKIEEISAKPFKEENVWAKVGNIRFGHPATPMILRYSALMWYHNNPPDPRGEPMFSRPAPYTVYVRREDMLELFPFGMRTIDRMLAEVRKAAYIDPYGKITVQRFCVVCSLPEDQIQQQLHEVFLKRWNKNKPRGE